MDIKRLSNELSASPQISLADVAKLKQLGFRSIVDNRPDDEEEGQPPFAAVAAAANEAGMATAYIPVVPGQLADEHVREFTAAIATLPTPILAFCRTGARSVTLWSLSEGTKGRPFGEIFETAETAGYDMSALEPRIAASQAS